MTALVALALLVLKAPAVAQEFSGRVTIVDADMIDVEPPPVAGAKNEA